MILFHHHCKVYLGADPSFLIAGEITSPNFPGDYPHNLNKTDTIVVKSKNTMRPEFTSFTVYVGGSINECPGDFVKITDGDGTILMDKSCGYSDIDPSHNLYFLPPIITTRTNKVKILFYTDKISAQPGWSLSWKALAPGNIKSSLSLLVDARC